MILRDATPGDAEAIAVLYAHYVRTSPATFEEEPPDAAEIRHRLKQVQGAGLPWRTAVEDEALVGMTTSLVVFDSNDRVLCKQATIIGGDL